MKTNTLQLMFHCVRSTNHATPVEQHRFCGRTAFTSSHYRAIVKFLEGFHIRFCILFFLWGIRPSFGWFCFRNPQVLFPEQHFKCSLNPIYLQADFPDCFCLRVFKRMQLAVPVDTSILKSNSSKKNLRKVAYLGNFVKKIN